MVWRLIIEPNISSMMASTRQFESFKVILTIGMFFSSIYLSLQRTNYSNFIVVSPNGNNTKFCLKYRSLERSARDPCKTLDYVFDFISSHKKNATKIVLEAGTYNLTKNASFDGIVNLEVSGNESTFNVEIACSLPDVGLTFLRSVNIRLKNVTITGCGALHHSTIGQAFSNYHKNHTLFYTGVFAAYCRNITIQSCSVRDSTGTGLTMYDVGGQIMIYNSTFARNTPNINTTFAQDNNFAIAGGGVYLELTYDGALPPFDVNDPERFAYQHGNHYLIKNCRFIDNKAPEQYFSGTFIEKPRRTHHIPFGRGGGVSIFFKGNATNNNVTLSIVNFFNNTALWGGGFFAEFQDNTENNHVTVFGSRFTKNNATTAGGGVRSGMIIWEGRLAANTIRQAENIYEENKAVLGGAVSHYGPSYFPVKDEEGIREVTFTQCVFNSNKATAGAALSFVTGLFDLLLNGLNNDKRPWKVVLENTTVHGSKIILTEDHKVIGQGALFTSGISVELRGHTLFSSNSNTALVLDNALLIVKDMNQFINNTGLQGGAIGVYGLSFINLMPESTMQFIANSATEKGGAMYVASNGPPVLGFQSTEIDDKNCFLGYNNENAMANIDQWNTSIIFSSNTAKTGGGNSVYAHSLQSCRKPGEKRTNNMAMQWGFITYRDNVNDFFDIKNEVATDPLDIVIYENDWRVAPGEEFNPTIKLFDEKSKLVQGIVQLNLVKRENTPGRFKPLEPSSLLLINPKNQNSSVVSGMKIKGSSKCPFRLTITTLSGQTIKKEISNLSLTDCHMGFKMCNDRLECKCRRELPGVSDCSEDLKYVYLYNGFWGGNVGNSFNTYPCPPGYCNKTVTSTTKSGNYKMIPNTLCADNRNQNSILCGSCARGCSVLLGCEECQCRDCNYSVLGWFVPVFCIFSAFFVIIVLFFDLDIFTVYLNAFLYVYQVIPYLISQDNKAFFHGDSFITFVIGLTNLRISTTVAHICIKNMTALKKLVLEYSFPVVIFIVLLILRITKLDIRISRLSSRYRWLQNARRHDGSYNATHALCNLLVLCYTDVILTSFKIIHYVHLNGKWVLYFDGSIDFSDWKKHVFATAVASLLLASALILAILLIVVPQFCTRLLGYQRVRLFFDIFQSCFEETSIQEPVAPNTPSYPISRPVKSPVLQCITDRSNRWFGGFYLLCRFMIILLALYVPYGPLQRSILEIACMIVASVCLYVKPYNSQLHWLNITDSLLLLTTCLITSLSTAVLHFNKYSNKLRLAVHVLTYLPLVYVAYLVYRCVKGCHVYYHSTLEGYHGLRSSQHPNDTSSTIVSTNQNSNRDDLENRSTSPSLTSSLTT